MEEPEESQEKESRMDELTPKAESDAEEQQKLAEIDDALQAIRTNLSVFREQMYRYLEQAEESANPHPNPAILEGYVRQARATVQNIEEAVGLIDLFEDDAHLLSKNKERGRNYVSLVEEYLQTFDHFQQGAGEQDTERRERKIQAFQQAEMVHGLEIFFGENLTEFYALKERVQEPPEKVKAESVTEREIYRVRMKYEEIDTPEKLEVIIGQMLDRMQEKVKVLDPAAVAKNKVYRFLMSERGRSIVGNILYEKLSTLQEGEACTVQLYQKGSEINVRGLKK